MTVLAAVPALPVAILVAALLGAAFVCVHRATTDPALDSPARRRQHSRAGDGLLHFGEISQGRVAAGLAMGFVALLATRWILLAVAAAALTIGWGPLLRDRRAEDERRRVEGIAKWLEDLRDTLRGSSVGAEEALEQVAQKPPDSLREPMAVFVVRLRQGFRTEDALVDLAGALDHPIADAAVAAIRLVVGGNAGAGRLYRTVNALAAAARDEVTARERIDRTRAVYRASMKRLVMIAVGLVIYLRFAAGDLLESYTTATGQVVLLLPLAMWAGCLLWLRRLCREQLPRPASGRATTRGVAA